MAQTSQDMSMLEAGFPHLTENLQKMWGDPSIERYFSTLWIDTRGNRRGFPPAVMSDLLMIASVHSDVFGAPTAGQITSWFASPLADVTKN
jgi:hypothetical protein